MAATATVDQILGNPDVTQGEQIVYGTIVLTGNYGGASTHGDTLNLSGLSGIQSLSVPYRVEIYEAPPAGTSATGFDFNFSPGTTQANGVLQVFGTPVTGSATTPLTEYTEGAAYDAALLAAVLKFKAWFPLFN